MRVPIPMMIDILEQNSRIRRMARQMVKAMYDLSELMAVTGVHMPEATQAEPQPDRDGTSAAFRLSSGAAIRTNTVANRSVRM